jgi:2-polyprenyl-3-methyl-5-hydroxy-6-metoxy-1,4-benzoquinol methylase
MKKENPYSSGDYYQETYMRNQMNIEKSTRWMMNYYNVIKKIFPEILKYKNNRILEVGSGFGGFISVLNKDGFIDVTASDMSKDIFSKKLNNKIITMDLMSEIDVEEKYDVIFAFDVMEHINNTEKAISKIARLLNDKGLFIFSTPYPEKKHLVDNYHTNMQYPNFYANIFKQNGFELTRIQDISFVPFFWRFKMPFFIKRIIKNKLFISETFFVFQKIK